MELAKLLHCNCYHSNSPKHPITDIERIRIMHSWTYDTEKILVSTTALSAGLDNTAIKLAFHVGDPPDFITFYQQSHHVGRNGYGACILIPAGKSLTMGDPKKHDYKMLRLCGRPAMIQYSNYNISQAVMPQRCLHYRLTEFLDGIGKICQNERCSGCISG
jgi:superfamily II DNA helicase RecQ